ncbi:Serine/threonine-protein kinase PknL [Firmicutes bacterium ASF500]|nr:Serine/threonine-protein kinase PknL [Firmicutes bacterium ASF500]
MYSWLTEKLRTEFEEVRLLKESPRGSVRLIRHNAGGKQFILRRFQGNGEVYHRLLGCSCRYLPLVYEAAEQDGENIVVEEFVQGDTLDFLLKEALFSPQETKQTVKQLCHGLWVLHSMAAVHRDIKPENVILRGNDTVLIDFDAARLHKPEAEADTHILGTTGFAAPEQYGLGQSDTRTDIYSLGVLMNVMLTGQHPSKKLAEGRLGRVIQRCTQVNPAKRYKDVMYLAEALS